MLTTEQAARLVLASAVRDAIADATEDIRGEIRGGLNPGDRTTAYIDGVNVGAVQLTQTKPTVRVVDYAELMAWVLTHVPAAVVTTQTVNQSWVTRIIRDGGEWTDPETGEVHPVPGLGTAPAGATLRVTLTDAARAWALSALETTMTHPLAIEAHDD